MVICKGKKDCLNYYVFDSRKSMGQQAADDIAKVMEKLLVEKDTINMIFAAAPSQNEVLAALTEKKLPWERVNAFHMDEYIGLHEDAPQRFGNFLKKAIFDKLPFRSVNYILGNAHNIEAECLRYGALLRDHPVDIVCLGIGENGHIAFNDPWVADFHDPCMIKQVDLDPMCRNQQVNDGCFGACILHQVLDKGLRVYSTEELKEMLAFANAAFSEWRKLGLPALHGRCNFWL